MSALICDQEATDGGAAGSCCNVNGTRQAGGLCAYPNICNGGLCSQVCDPNPPAGADAGFPCDTAGGPQYCFFPGVAQSGSATGTCTPPCDSIAHNDAGGCPVAAAGNPVQQCTPAYLFDQGIDPTVSDTTIGVCSAAPTTGTILDVGAACGAPGTSCREGSVCQPSPSGNQFCRHLCGPVGSIPSPGVDGGDNGCVSGETCFWFVFGTVAPGTKSTKIGFCDVPLADGGPT
jgi:hypothetical protein